MTLLTPSLHEVLNAGHLVHLVTVNEDGSPQLSVIWVGTEGDEIVSAHIPAHQKLYKKLRNIQRDPRVSLSLEIDGDNGIGMANHLVIEGKATVTEGGAPELLHRLAQVYIGPGAKFPPTDSPLPGYVVHIVPEKIRGLSPLLDG